MTNPHNTPDKFATNELAANEVSPEGLRQPSADSRLKKICRTFALLAAGAVGAGAACDNTPGRGAIGSPENPDRVRIVHFNDFHGHLEQAARISTVVRRLISEAGNGGYSCTLILNGGDLISGPPISEINRGIPEALFLNKLGVHASVAGNHEFDYGILNFDFMSGLAMHSPGAANMTDRRTGTLLGRWGAPVAKFCSHPFVAITGLGHPNTNLMPKEARDLIDIGDPLIVGAEMAEKMAADPYTSKSDIQIALTHQGKEGDLKLAEAVPSYDAIIGGHDHIVDPDQHCEMVGHVPVCQTPPNGTAVGVVDLDVVGQRVVGVGHRLVPITDDIPPDPEIEKWLAPYLKEAAEKTGVVIGKATADIPRGSAPDDKFAQMPAGKFVAEIMRQAVGADFAIANSGGIRAGLKAGNVTWGDAWGITPFTNSLMLVEMTGLQIKGLLQESLNAKKTLQLAGFDYETDLDLGRIYTVAVSDYLVLGGSSGYTVFKEPSPARILLDTKTFVRDFVIKYVKERESVEPM